MVAFIDQEVTEKAAEIEAKVNYIFLLGKDPYLLKVKRVLSI
jgi:hypothetical protein